LIRPVESVKSVEFRLAVENSTDHVDRLGINEIIPRVVGRVGKVGKVFEGSPGVEILEMLNAESSDRCVYQVFAEVFNPPYTLKNSTDFTDFTDRSILGGGWGLISCPTMIF
jgi:hypothetical protein